MRRGRFGTGAVLTAFIAVFLFAAPVALADNGSATDQGYPCATQPNGGSVVGGDNCTPPPQCAPGTTINSAGQCIPTEVVSVTPSSGTLGAQKTVTHRVAAAGVAPLNATRATGTLPFTGLQLTVFAIVGIALVAGGLLLRSTSRKRSEL